MTTAFSDIVGAFKAALESAPAVSANIYRARTRPIADELNDAVNVFFESATPTPATISGAPIDWSSRIVVELYARSSADSGDVAIDTLLGAACNRLAADTTLGGLVFDISAPTIDADYDSQGQKTGWLRLTYSVEHRTANLSITTQHPEE